LKSNEFISKVYTENLTELSQLDDTPNDKKDVKTALNLVNSTLGDMDECLFFYDCKLQELTRSKFFKDKYIDAMTKEIEQEIKHTYDLLRKFDEE